MTHMVQFIHFFKKDGGGWRTSVQLPDGMGWAGSSNLPPGIKPEWLVRIADGHYRTRRPVEFDLGDIRQGQRPGVSFADVSNVRERRTMADAAFDAVIAAVDAAEAKASAQTAPAAIETDLV